MIKYKKFMVKLSDIVCESHDSIVIFREINTFLIKFLIKYQNSIKTNNEVNKNYSRTTSTVSRNLLVTSDCLSSSSVRSITLELLC